MDPQGPWHQARNTMKITRAASLTLLVLAGCIAQIDLGDVPGSSTGTPGSSSTGEPSTTSATNDPTDTPTTTTDDPGTTTGTTNDPTTATTTDPGTTTGTTDDPSTGGPAIDCNQVSQGPWTIEPWLMHHDNAFDLGFDGLGNLAAVHFNDLVIVGADTNEYILVQDLPLTEGMRFLADGRLLVTHSNDIHAIDPQGFSKKFIVDSGFAHPSRLQPDHAGNVWLIDDTRLVRIAPDLTRSTLFDSVSSLTRPRDMIYDEQRRVVFFADYQNYPTIKRLPVDENGTPGELTTIYEDKAANHGIGPLALDACGNLYFVEVANGNLMRMMLDPDGLAGPVVPLLNIGPQVFSINFASGPGFDPRTLHVVGMGTGVLRVTLDFPGAPAVTVE